ncbi:MAG: NADH-quinone oxidoreductase subunit N [Melioribacteraceae bacterium]|nr:NADH-quinone oxidoreductase subunit N [Melioribacteraceae bacterium]
MPQNSQEIFLMLPHVVIGVGIVISLLIEMYSKKSETILPWISLFVFVFAGVHSIINISENQILFGGMLEVGGKPAIFNFIFNIGAALLILNSIDYIKKYESNHGEYYILIQSAILGMMVMAGSKDIFMIFIGLELMSIAFYVLAGINKKKSSSNEAALKYFLLGAFATGFIVYGIALIYGVSSTTSVDSIIQNFSTFTQNILFIVGLLLFIIGFSFKIAAFPFHMWVPDVYQGSATTVTGLMSTTGKTAAFSVLLIILSASLINYNIDIFAPYFAVIATLSMLYGSIVAIAQKNLKRMLAYSSISHAGYMAIGLAAANSEAFSGIIFYLAAYTFMNIGAFGIISIIEKQKDANTDLSAYAGLASKSPILAAFMSLFMFALAGIPPLAGFFGKYYVFISVIEADLTWLAVVGVFSSVISVYFYLRLVVYMYFKESEKDIDLHIDKYSLLSVVVSGILVIYFGISPDSLLNLILSVVN